MPDERDAFIEFAKFQTDLDSLDDIHNLKTGFLIRLILHAKHFFYAVQFLLFPINLAASSSAYAGALMCSMLVRHLKTDITGNGFFH